MSTPISSPGFSNRLAQETSPYLLQHAHNPVEWYPWGEEALTRAQAEQKPILVSIGYAACHWCHVMERESFENPQIAAVMNRYFICIKVDREERPDVDQVYMDALQAMGLAGGWPLNVFLNPEAKPFYGGTYFQPRNWVQLLESIGRGYAGEHRAELDASADQFAQVLQASELDKYRLPATNAGLSDDQFKLLVYNLAARFDHEKGGINRAPKFPMPSIWRFLLRTHALTNSDALLAQLHLTLREMAWGGIHDQVGGGFARYSVDENWLVPHFEKMLYDNGQLLSLYAEAFQHTQDELYRQVTYGIVGFVERELMSPNSGFYSSLDADSEGEEGKFYIWTRAELQAVLGDEELLASEYYGCTALGNWEHGSNILHRQESDKAFAQHHQLAPSVLADLVSGWKHKLLQARESRLRPGLDDKILTGWNALMLQGLIDAYRAFQEPKFLKLALRNAAFLQQNLRLGNQLYRNYKNGHATIHAFLEDYALLIQAYISLYEATFAEEWLHEADALVAYVLENFFDPTENQFFYTNARSEALIARKKELFDNVIPASNSVMAHNLHRLGLHLEKERYTELAGLILQQVHELVVKEPHNLANWAALYAARLRPTAEVAIVGPEAARFRANLSQHYLPNVVLAGTSSSSELPLLANREARHNSTTIYVCYNRTCQQPVHSVAEALAQLA
ncbi:thioredoxin domain-containing protein [Hymenobacter taeanensis]|uniref:Thioredoxin domain-containing protein n=1 Tax=Hymenobacter taeanensis TaxID=2735321 RepID=A0A6M6BF38_9BACT|nr:MULTISPECIES: thioredoxin domain-containing protein [Hymenobacter]QJX45765.1 thioredoxin domain-containing protein [Hymenobacter taeanensis]UOQ79608.1 thioredoxin domain-containing protein [Hymenobacter sp. 5414T-23]